MFFGLQQHDFLMIVGRHTLCLVLSHSNAKLLKAYRFPLWKLSLSPVSPLTVYSNRGTWHECVEASFRSADSVGIRLRIDFPSNIWTKKCDILFYFCFDCTFQVLKCGYISTEFSLLISRRMSHCLDTITILNFKFFFTCFICVWWITPGSKRARYTVQCDGWKRERE